MHTIDVALGERSYPIHIGAGTSCAKRGAARAAVCRGRACSIVSNPIVAALWLDAAAREPCRRPASRCETLLVPTAKRTRHWPTLHDVLTRLPRARARSARRPIVALGGGVVGDIAGFAAAIYQRGVPFVQSPDHAARAGRLVGRRQDRRQSSARQEHDRRVPPAARRADRHRLPATRFRIASSPPGSPKSIKYGAIRDARILRVARSATCDALRRARRRRAGARGHRKLPDQGGDRRRRRTRSGRARAAQFRPHVRPRDRDRRRATANGCTARRLPPAWSMAAKLSARIVAGSRMTMSRGLPHCSRTPGLPVDRAVRWRSGDGSKLARPRQEGRPRTGAPRAAARALGRAADHARTSVESARGGAARVAARRRGSRPRYRLPTTPQNERAPAGAFRRKWRTITDRRS